jgi:hypothetical protein
MRMRVAYLGGVLPVLMSLSLLLTVLPEQVLAQGEVTSKIYRYRERVASGYYEGYEVSPRRQRARVAIPGTPRGTFPFGTASSAVRLRSRLPDSHRGLKFYERTTCIECHPREARDLHSTRADITCRQCHGPEPIAAIDHYYSPMNSIRRYAYICSKCHEGATVNFADFYVHEPPAGSLETWKSFPVLFVAYWGMLLLLVGTLAFFVPHALMVGARELTETRAFRIPRLITGHLFESLKQGFRSNKGKRSKKKKARADEGNNAH